MVLVGHVDVVAGPDVVADLDREVPDDAAALADQAPVADADHRIADAILARHHAGRQRGVRADHRVAPDADVALVEDRVRGEADDAALPELTESPSRRAVRADRRPPGHGVAHAADRLAREVVSPAHGPEG